MLRVVSKGSHILEHGEHLDVEVAPAPVHGRRKRRERVTAMLTQQRLVI